MYRYRLQTLVIVGVLVALVLARTAGPAPDAHAVAAAAPLRPATLTAAIEVLTRDAATGQPVSGATVTVADLGLSGQTDPLGQWRITTPVSAAELPVTVTVQAPGYGAWTLQAVRVLAEDTLYVTVELGPQASVSRAPDPTEREHPPLDTPPALDDPFLTVGLDQTGLPLPAYIRVRVTGYAHCDLSRPYEVRWVDFRQYLKHVLPNEWPASWARESLRAGAIAVKMYAWSLIARGGKWRDADVYDSTCDQVYRPSIAYASTNAAVDDTLHWRLTRDNRLFATYYRAYASQCPDSLAGTCLGQWDSKARADSGQLYPQILSEFYTNTRLNLFVANHALRFSGSALAGQDRVRIPIDNPATPADIGATDSTLEFWLRAQPGANMIWDPVRTPDATCGPNDGWLNGSVLFDRDSGGPAGHGDYGLSLVAGRIAFGVNNGVWGTTLCSVTAVDDDSWHHVAVTRRLSDGRLRIWINGRLDAETSGPVGDISYPDGRPPAAEGDTWLVLGGRKIDSDSALRLAFTGWLDEVRLSTSERYTDPARMYTPATRFSPDAATAALYHFDEVAGAGACTGGVADESPSRAAGGECVAGSGVAPVFTLNTNPRQWAYVYLTGIQRDAGP